MSYSSWHVGMKVVCVNDQWVGTSGAYSSRGLPCPLEAGRVYTIAEIRAGDPKELYGDEVPDVVVRLDGVTKQKIDNVFVSDFFAACRFRPVQTRKTSIEIFNRILRNPKIRIKEGA